MPQLCHAMALWVTLLKELNRYHREDRRSARKSKLETLNTKVPGAITRFPTHATRLPPMREPTKIRAE
jgi:hypothetical protein